MQKAGVPVIPGTDAPLAGLDEARKAAEREARRAYGFDEIALVPGKMTINPAEVDVSTTLGGIKLKIPIIASAMVSR